MTKEGYCPPWGLTGVRFYFVESFLNMVSLQEVSGAPPRSRLATEL